ncbi:glycosyltransferase family 2 protein, partial [Halomonas sp. BC1]|uniref:glycosyltransferase family 2 protein n=1 Tax=Halomonas sp. BC1 TaxID=1670448 RepID=UPI00159370BD
MNSFIFYKIKESYESCNYNYASILLNKIDYNSLNDSGRNLYDHFLVKLKKKIEIKHEPEYQDGLLSLHDNKSIVPGISLVSCCMNRNENLIKSMHSWLKLPVDEIIIVDWSSTVPVTDSLSCFDDQRIKIIRVEGERKWVLTYAFNVGLRFSRFSKIFKLDADIYVKDNFLENNYFAHGEFIRGSWEKSLEAGLDDQIFVNGSFGASKDDLKKIGYYNEYITTYGWDDSDLYERLAVKAGLKTKYLVIDSLIHIEQKQEERTINQSLPNSNFLGKVSVTEFNNSVNKYIARVHDFWTENKLNDYFLERKGINYWVANRTTEGVTVPRDFFSDSKLYAANLFSF